MGAIAFHANGDDIARLPAIVPQQVRHRGQRVDHILNLGADRRPGHSPFTIPSTIFLASANSIIVLSLKKSSFSTPA